MENEKRAFRDFYKTMEINGDLHETTCGVRRWSVLFIDQHCTISLSHVMPTKKSGMQSWELEVNCT